MGSKAARDELTAEASAWLIGLDTGTADRAAFETWRAADPRHASAFAQAAAVWQQTAAARGTGGGAAEGATPAIPAAPAPAPAAPATAAPNRRGAIRMTAAAAAGLSLAGAGWWWLDRPAQIATLVGERRSARIDPWVRVDLNTDTLMRLRTGAQTEMTLAHGEAAIAVGEGIARPALLRTGALSALLWPGSYVVRLLAADAPAIIVLAGAARIMGEARTLRPGDRVREARGRVIADMLPPPALEIASAWQRGEIVFDGGSLAGAVAEFNRYLDRKLVIGDPALGAIRLGGRFHVDDPDGFLRALRQGFGIAVRAEADRIVLTRS